MNKLILTLLVFVPLFFGSCQIDKEQEFECKTTPATNGECSEDKIKNQTTSFPETSPADDYKVRLYQAKIALPLNETESRVWVKGKENLSFVQLFTEDGSTISDPYELAPPFYTTVISFGSDHRKVKIAFSDTASDLATSDKTIQVFPKNRKEMNEATDQFSMLFYGCFQPFRVNQETGKSEVLHQEDTLNYVIRQMFTAISQEREFDYFPFEQSTKKHAKLLSQPKVIIGGGDQVYTDAGYADTEMKDHPLSGWAHKCTDPYPLLDTVEFMQHLDRCYRHFNSFRCFEEVFSILPSISTWDDHEIRDGWGSHGDEYDGEGELTADLKSYYMMSRKAYIEHQYSTGPNAHDDQTISSNQSLEQITTVNGVSIFMFDLRSNRNSCQDEVISEEQMQAFKDWCASLEDDQEVVIVSSIPFFYASGDVVTALSEQVYEGEMRDDIIDSWASTPNIGQRDSILQQLINLRQREVKPIILSGDVHIGALITAWYENPKNNKLEKLCYELISSGLSHESLGEARSFIANNLKTRSKDVKSGDPTILVNDIAVSPMFDFTRGRLNFGALEFTKSKKTVASLFIIGDENNQVVERELLLDWSESFEQFWEKAKKPFSWYFMPWKWFKKELPEVPYHSVEITELLNTKK